MPAKKATSSHGPTSGYCPTCGQRIKLPSTELAKLGRKYLEKRDLTQAELARKIGRSPQAVGFWFTGSEGASSRPYLGLRSAKKGEKPLAFQIKEALEIPDAEFGKALLADEMKLAGVTWSRCSTTSLVDQRLCSHQQASSGTSRPLVATSAA